MCIISNDPPFFFFFGINIFYFAIETITKMKYKNLIEDDPP